MLSGRSILMAWQKYKTVAYQEAINLGGQRLEKANNTRYMLAVKK